MDVSSPEEMKEVMEDLLPQKKFKSATPSIIRSITKSLGWDIDPETWLKYLNQPD